MGFDVNSDGTSATVLLSPRSCMATLPPKPPTSATPSVYPGKKLAAVTSSVSSTPRASGSGGYSLYSLIKKQSQNAPGPVAQKPVVTDPKPCESSPAKTVTSCLPVGILKKPSVAESVTVTVRSQLDSKAGTNAAVGFTNCAEKSTVISDSDDISPQRFELLSLV